MLKRILLGACALSLLAGCSDKAANIDAVKDDVTDATPASSVSPDVQKLIDTALSGTQAYDIVESLTTEVGPRLAGTDAEAKARDWAVETFKTLGLENVRVEPFTIPGWERGEETAEIISPYAQNLFITSLGGSVATPASGITAPIAYFETFEPTAKDALAQQKPPNAGRLRLSFGLLERIAIVSRIRARCAMLMMCRAFRLGHYLRLMLTN